MPSKDELKTELTATLMLAKPSERSSPISDDLIAFSWRDHLESEAAQRHERHVRHHHNDTCARTSQHVHVAWTFLDLSILRDTLFLCSAVRSVLCFRGSTKCVRRREAGEDVGFLAR